jgi:oxaloacetate decarboxylase gamma subunit
MEETNLVLEGIKFMVLGMGTVFVFLGVMIVVMNLMSKIIHKYFPEPAPSASSPGVTSDGADKKKVVAAIVAAIMEDKKSQA